MTRHRSQWREKLGELFQKLDDNWLATVTKVEELGEDIVNVMVKAPAQARAFSPGQFYRVQNYTANAASVHGTELAAEGMALTGRGGGQGKWNHISYNFGDGRFIKIMPLLEGRQPHSGYGCYRRSY